MKQCHLFLSAIVILITMSFKASASQNIRLYVGQSTFVSCPDAPQGAIFQTAWGSNNPCVSVKQEGTYGAKIEVISYFTGIAQVQCDYYWSWYVGNKYFTSHATTFYNVTCEKVNIRIDQTGPIQLNSGDGIDLSVTLTPSINPAPSVMWNSSNINVAEVSQNGYVWARQPGTSIISASSNAGPDEATITINVNPVNVERATITSSIALEAGQSRQLSVSVSPSNANITSVSWHSLDNSIATVNSSGIVTAIKHGTTSVYCIVNGTVISNYANVTVSKSDLTLSANVDDGLLEKGTQVTLTANNIDANIFYTLDGSNPSQNSMRYDSPIVIDRDMTLRAIAYHEDYNTSKVLTKSYKVTSLKIVNAYPNRQNGEVGNYATIAIVYNSPIVEGFNFNKIQLSCNGQKVNGDTFISNNKLFFVPDLLLVR